MPRFTTRHHSVTVINGIPVLVLTADPSASFALLSAEIAFSHNAPTNPITAEGGLIDIALQTVAGGTPTNLVAKPCDPAANGVNLVTPRHNYVTPPSFGTSRFRIACPPREVQYLSWDEGDFVVPAGGGVCFVHNTGASMPSNAQYKLTVEWVE